MKLKTEDVHKPHRRRRSSTERYVAPRRLWIINSLLRSLWRHPVPGPTRCCLVWREHWVVRRHARARQLSNIIIIYAVHYRRGKTNSLRCAVHGIRLHGTASPATYFRAADGEKWPGNRMAFSLRFTFIGIHRPGRRRQKTQVARNEVVPAPLFSSLGRPRLPIHFYFSFHRGHSFETLFLYHFRLHFICIQLARAHGMGERQRQCAHSAHRK